MLRTADQREEREAAMRMRMGRATMAEPAAAMPAPAPAKPLEEEYTTPAQLARLWHVSPTTIRHWFKNEPGVIRWGNDVSRPGKRKAHLSLRIPAHVVERVRRRMARD